MKNILKFRLMPVIVMAIAIFSGCTEDTFDSINVVHQSIGYNYLEIKGLSIRTQNGKKLELNQQEKLVLYKTFDRIVDNVKDQQVEVDLSQLTASKLNVDETLFILAYDFLVPYITGKKVVGEEESSDFAPRVKTRAEGDTSGGSTGSGSTGGSMTDAEIAEWIKLRYSKDEMFNLICIQGNLSDFEKKCFSQYWYGRGNMKLSEIDWVGIKNATDRAGYNDPNISKNYTVMGIKYYEKVVSYYNNSTYDYALGKATVTFLEGGEPVGLHDLYDFNIIGADRDWKADGIVVGINVLTVIYGGKPYHITYGVYR